VGKGTPKKRKLSPGEALLKALESGKKQQMDFLLAHGGNVLRDALDRGDERSEWIKEAIREHVGGGKPRSAPVVPVAGLPLTPAQDEIWNLLAGKCYTAKKIADALGKDEGCVRNHIRGIWARNGKDALPHRRGLGYFRTDMPPDWGRAKTQRAPGATAAQDPSPEAEPSTEPTWTPGADWASSSDLGDWFSLTPRQLRAMASRGRLHPRKWGKLLWYELAEVRSVYPSETRDGAKGT
jgi:DNA-binding CsgD family transcriptional regulator